MKELWQLYDEQANPLVGKGATKEEAFKSGLLHSAAHVWVWRRTPEGVGVLAQKRAAVKRTWPNLYDATAAGHVNLGEKPLQAAVREAEEEIGLDISAEELQFIKRLHARKISAGNGDTENEFRWIYFYQMRGDFNFRLKADEVASLEWKTVSQLEAELVEHPERYLPQGKEYYGTLLGALQQL